MSQKKSKTDGKSETKKLKPVSKSLEWVDEILNAYDGDVPPAGCRACGGPYPSCTTSCSMFDD